MDTAQIRKIEKNTNSLKRYAFGRVGLLGNPSDHYGGKCISFTFNKSSEVTVRADKSGLVIENEAPLIRAAIKNLDLDEKNFKISYRSNIPRGVGLAGSSAILVATIRALNDWFGLGLSDFEIAEKALRVETDELGISVGFQDSYSVTFGGIVYMDLTGKEFIKKYPEDPYGKVEKLPLKQIPCFLCLSGAIKIDSGAVHNSLREKFLNGSRKEQKQIKEFMGKIGNLAEQGKKPIIDGGWEKLGFLMNKNRELRNQVIKPKELDEKAIEQAFFYGALGAKLTGSGGTVVILTDENDKNNIFEKMSRNYACFKPKIVDY